MRNIGPGKSKYKLKLYEFKKPFQEKATRHTRYCFPAYNKFDKYGAWEIMMKNLVYHGDLKGLIQTAILYDVDSNTKLLSETFKKPSLTNPFKNVSRDIIQSR